MKRSLNKLVIVFLPALVLACNLGTQPTPDAAATLNPLYTSAAQTLESMQTQAATTPRSDSASATPLPTGSPTNTLVIVPPTSTSFQLPMVTKKCDAATFVKDVTVPDGAAVKPNSTFTKTWRIQNTGTCRWTTSYALVFISGDSMNAPAYISLPDSVDPGETIDLSISLKSPTKSGHYKGNWELRNASGVLFGIGAQANTPFWVDVYVTGPEFVAYDFVANACDADWKGNRGVLPCPGTEDDENGYVLILSTSRMEDGTKEQQPGLLTVPKNVPTGYIQGRYPAFKVQQGDRFVTKINCQYNSNNCDVLFRLEYRIVDEPIRLLLERHELYEGKYYEIDFDLSSLAGQKVKFFLTVSSNNNKGKDNALWVEPRIIRQGTPQPTATATATPTSTGTPTTTGTP